jgi:hypothetical protein
VAKIQGLEKALSVIRKKIDESLKAEVADAVRDEEMIAIATTVYAAYGNNSTGEPNVYERRGSDGGLADPNNMPSEVNDGTLRVWNITPANSEYPPDYGNDGFTAGEIVLNGGPYHHPKGANTFGDFHLPRDFIGATYSGLRSSKTHVSALKEGLTKRGLTVK